MRAFNDIFVDCTCAGTKVPKEKYLENGKNIIVDQGQNIIAGYTNLEDGLYTDVPAIIFGDHTRIIKYVEIPFFLGADGVKLLKSKDSDANYKYLYYALKNARIPDTGYNRHFKWLKEVKIEYPDSNVQKKVVNILDKISKIIGIRKKVLEKLDNLIKARFVEMFGDPLINPKKYTVQPLSTIAKYWNGLTYKPEDVSKEGIIVLRSSNIQNDQLDFSDTVRVNCRIAENKLVKDNDILMCSRNGSAKLVGKVALIKNLPKAMSFGAFMMIIRSEYYPYLMTYFQMPAFRAQIITGATTTINQITGKMLDNVKLPIPDLSEIKEYLGFVQRIDKSKFVVQQALDKAQLLFDSLMQKYFG